MKRPKAVESRTLSIRVPVTTKQRIELLSEMNKNLVTALRISIIEITDIHYRDACDNNAEKVEIDPAR